jgi:hypothetical protein
LAKSHVTRTLRTGLMSLTLLGSVVLLIRSSFREDDITFYPRSRFEPDMHAMISIYSRKGILSLYVSDPAMDGMIPQLPAPQWCWYSSRLTPDAARGPSFGFSVSRNRDTVHDPYSTHRGGELSLDFPVWLLALIATFPIIWSVSVTARRRRRASYGRCTQCGYDLRASPERCPECGKPAAFVEGRTAAENGTVTILKKDAVEFHSEAIPPAGD